MMYIITPQLRDFEWICREHKLRSRHDALWIDNITRLRSRRIHKEDVVVWGEKAHLFTPEQLKELEFEVRLKRSREQ